jgi:hypothetical protein
MLAFIYRILHFNGVAPKLNVFLYNGNRFKWNIKKNNCHYHFGVNDSFIEKVST